MKLPIEALALLEQGGVPIALVTSGSGRRVRRELATLGVDSRFSCGYLF
jgi:phosphoglycolate phosphatase-like HAD superfamily hydrolase